MFAAASRPPRRLLGRPEAEALSARRLPWLMGGMVLWAAAIFLRLVWLQVIEHRHYASRAEGQHLVRIPIMPIRGELRDRKGDSLAISLKVESLFCDPRVFYPDATSTRGENGDWGRPDRHRAEEVAAKLAPILEMPRSVIMDRLLKKKPFVWVERQLPPTKVAAIRALELEGFDFQVENRRFYPRSSLACQILGFTNIDGQGQLGIEQAYDSWLAGRKGELVAARDAHGKLLALQESYASIPVNGSSIQLSIDATIQHIVEDAMVEAVNRSHPRTAYAVVVDPDTGEILAMAGTPTFDPNQILPKKFRNRYESEMSPAEQAELRAELERQKAARKVHPVEDAYEPGSTMKIFTAAIALEERKVHLGEKVDCGPGRWVFGPKNIVTDTHKHGVISFEEVLWQSSNIGAAKIGTRLDPADHYQYLRKFGFGDATGLNFPGETSGKLIAPDRWSPSTQVTMSFGYGLSASPLQVLMAGCAIANGGRLMKPILVERIYNDQGSLLKENHPEVRDQVLSEETSGIMKDVLKGVITNGTARRAKLDGGVEAFGKTGTSRKIINGEYDAKRHYASFMGFFPAEKPQYGVLVMLDDPQGDVTGGDVAAPLFAEIGNAILRYQQTAGGRGNDADLKLSLRDWPVGQTDEATFHIEQGKVPDLKGLSLKAAIQRVVMAGGLPVIEGAPSGPSAAQVVDQSPAAGTDLEHGQKVKIRMGGS
ncbi:MAG TPA: penicillin-binding transpeptidase domain-containing protein [Holophagaceae bacterium]|nr:penicillin-binding transpeptidase domain-containing protein [Holophagaceae bacterium]